MQYKKEIRAALSGLEDYNEAESYYEGTVPETFATAKVRRALRVSGEAGGLNFCRTVVDTVNDRLEIASVGTPDEAGRVILGDLWENELSLEVAEIHRRTLVFGDSYAIVWPDEAGTVQVTYNSPLTTTLAYDPEHPRRKLYATKLWISEGRARLNIYTPEAVYRLQAQGENVTEGTNWTLLETIENPFGEVPVFHFRTHRPYGRPEHRDAYTAQNAVTKHFVNSLVVADYQAAPQRYALSKMAGGEVDLNDYAEGTDRENVGALKNGPGELWYLKGIDKVGQFDPADPDVFWKPITNSVRSMASITSTPLHYFDNSRANISGESLRVAESPLLKKVKDRQSSLGATWRELFKFVLRVNGIDADVEVKWQPNESLDELERWDVMLKKINAGLSHRQALREGGYDEEMIEKIMTERTQEANAGLYYQRAPQTRVDTEHDERNEA